MLEQHLGWLVLVGFGGLLVAASLIDTKQRIIPNWVIGGLCVLRVLAAVATFSWEGRFGLHALAVSLAGAVVLAAALLLLEVLVRRMTGASQPTFGMGDVKLLAACCLFLDPAQIMTMILLVCVVGVVLALGFKAFKGDSTFPFAPAIAVGALLAYVWW